MLRISDSVTATGRSAALVVNKGRIRLSGTWAGTVNIQTDMDNDATWSDELDPATDAAIAITGNGSFPIDNSVPMKTAVYFTRTSGTLEVVIVGDTAP